ncbi:MAG TPA: Gfo/Idh/MocA family oxidoreductase [Planctomycetaceae bacterium]|nr:Gfo/Idh/MocA family oxidoreductase [Planctomycetaceae bacterium]
MDKVRIAIIGAGAVSDYHHMPGIRIDPRAELVAVCDPNEELLAQRLSDWGRTQQTTDYEEIASDPGIDAVLIATPNFTHAPIALACIDAGKHVMCEKPLGLDFGEARRMYQAARDKGVRHMTAFTYRFTPALRYLKHLVATGALGAPRHFRSQRFLDLPETSWGWRQYKDKAGAGDLFDMTIHRIDFAWDILGPIRSVCGAVATFAPRDRLPDGTPCPPSEVDDWSSIIGQFASGAVGVWEGSTLMKGYFNSGLGYEIAEVNGSTGSAAYQLSDPNRVLLSLDDRDMETKWVPDEFLVVPGSPRDPHKGAPSTVFRYDLVYEFVSAIVEGRDAVPGFDDGARAQAVADAVLVSFAERRWVDVEARLD